MKSFFSFKSCDNSENEYHKKFAVVSAKIEASKAGYEILKMGGNAFDAMIATDLALAVVYPNADNLCGDGYLVFRLIDGVLYIRGSQGFSKEVQIEGPKEMEIADFKYRNGVLTLRIKTSEAL